MKRLGLLTIVVLVVMGGIPPAGAQTVDELPVSGSAAGVATLVFYSDPSCVHGILLDMTMIADVAPFGTGSIILHTCDLRPAGGVLESSFTLTAADGTVSGTVPSYTVTAAPVPQPNPFHFDVSILSGTGRYTGAVGALALDGAFTPGPPPVTATVSGTISVPRVEPPPPPKPGCGPRGPHHDDHGHRHHGGRWHR